MNSRFKFIAGLILIIMIRYAGAQVIEKANYFPLYKGMTRVYVSQTDTNAEKIIDTISIQGQVYYQFNSFRIMPGYSFRLTANQAYLYVDTSAFVWYDFTAEPGDTWTAPASPQLTGETSTFTLISNDETVVTPAGTFTGCYLFDQFIGYDFGYDEWFAKGIGIVRRDVITIAGANTWLLADTVLVAAAEHDYANRASQDDLLFIYPIPFKTFSTILYYVKSPSRIVLKIADIKGKVVMTPVNAFKTTGQYDLMLDTDGLPEGIYNCILTCPAGTKNFKMIKLY